jgi:hypothetical protein
MVEETPQDPMPDETEPTPEPEVKGFSDPPAGGGGTGGGITPPSDGTNTGDGGGTPTP